MKNVDYPGISVILGVGNRQQEQYGRRVACPASVCAVNDNDDLYRKEQAMQGDIVKAAKWFGLCLVASTLILVIGLWVIVNKSTRQLGKDMITAGSSARAAYAPFPNTITLHHSSSGPFQLDLSPNNKDINLSPLKIELTTPQPAPQN
jgi:hypothetical protein